MNSHRLGIYKKNQSSYTMATAFADTGHGTLYTSDATGVIFSESLKRHLYPNFRDVTDFYRVRSMRSVYLASQLESDKSIHTVITFDRGATWQPVKRPAGVVCKDESKVSTLICAWPVFCIGCRVLQGKGGGGGRGMNNLILIIGGSRGAGGHVPPLCAMPWSCVQSCITSLQVSLCAPPLDHSLCIRPCLCIILRQLGHKFNFNI